MENKKLHLELLRFLSILMVIFNHTGKAGYLYFTTVQADGAYALYYLCSVLCKIAVPLFWMVSGALLIPKEESIGELFKKRVLRIFIVLTVTSFGYYLYSALYNPDFTFSPIYFVRQLYSSDMAPAFWYLYAYLGMLLILPLLRKLAKALSNHEFYYFFGIMLLIRGVLPVLEYALWHGEISLNSSFTANFFSYDVVFFLAGYFIENRLSDTELTLKSALILQVFALVALVFMMGGTQLLLNDGALMSDANAERFYAGLLLLPSCALFYSLRYFLRRAKNTSAAARAVCALGSVSFGVMLLEHFVRSESGFIFNLLCAVLPEFTACLVWVLIIYLICAVFVFLLKLIPGVKKYI